MAAAACGWILLLAVVGCKGPTLPATPNLYSNGIDPFVGVPVQQRSADVEILYATDRRPTNHGELDAAYGSERSTTLVVGLCTVTLGCNLGWNELVEASLDPRTSERVPLAVTRMRELVRLPSSVSPLVLVNGDLVEDPAVTRQRVEAGATVLAIISRRLATSRRKEIVVFVHGINNSIEDPMYRMAQLWHMMGRSCVPIASCPKTHPSIHAASR